MLKAYLKKIILPTLVMVWAFTYYLECLNYKLKSRRMVMIVFFMMLGLYVINGLTDFFETRKEWRKQQAENQSKGAQEEKKQPFSLQRMLSSGTGRMVAIFAVLIAYVLLLEPVGFILTTLACALLVMLIMGERKWFMLVLIPIALSAALYLIFRFGLNIPLPKGILTIL